MAQQTVSQVPDGRSSKTPRVIRSVPSENVINTGAALVHSSGPGGTLPIALNTNVRAESCQLLNQLLADTMTLRDLYKKHHWQVAGPWFYSLHLLFDKHYQEQAELMDEIAERIRVLGGISVAMGHDVAQLTQIPKPPLGRETTRQQCQRLLQAHETILQEAHAGARQTSESGDDGSNDLIVSSVIRTNELQSWFVGQHLAEEPGEASPL